MRFNKGYTDNIFSHSKEIKLINECERNVCLIKKPFKKDFLDYLREFLPEQVPISFRSGRGFELTRDNKNTIPKAFSSFIVPGEYIGIESSTLDKNLVKYLLSTIENIFNLNPINLISTRFQFNIFPLNAIYNTLSLIPHVDLVSKKNDNVPIAININLNAEDLITTGFFKNTKFNTKVYTRSFIEKNNLTGDFFQDFNFQNVLDQNDAFSYSDEIKLNEWKRYKEINLEPGDISIYLGSYFHSPILNRKKFNSNEFRISIAGFLIYADETKSMLMRFKKSNTLINHENLRGYRLEP